MDRLGVKAGGESRVKSRNKYLIKKNKFANKRRMEVSQHCRKFIYKHSDISIFAVCHLFYFFYNFFYLHRCGKNIFTNKFSSSGIYRYFNSSVRRVKRMFCFHQFIYTVQWKINFAFVATKLIISSLM